MRKKGVCIKVAKEFYDKMEVARRAFEKENGLNNVRITAFTGLLAHRPNLLNGGMNVKKQKRRRN